MKNLTILVVGYDWKDFKDLDDTKLIYYTSDKPENFSAREIVFFIRKAVQSSDVIVVNGCKEFNIDEIFTLQLAYSINTPILMVGKKDSIFLQEVVTNNFNTLEELKDHLKAYYINNHI